MFFWASEKELRLVCLYSFVFGGLVGGQVGLLNFVDTGSKFCFPQHILSL